MVVAGDADADGQPVTPGPPVGLLGSNGVVVDGGHGLGQISWIVGLVVDGPGRSGVGHGLWPDQVAAPDLDRVEVDLDGEAVDEAFEGGDLGTPTGPPVGRGRRSVGQHRDRPEVDLGDVVAAVGHLDRVAGGQVDPDERVGTGILHQLDVEVVESAGPVAGQGHGDALAPTLRRRGEVFRTGLVPADGTTEPLGQDGDEELLGRAAGLAPEPAADRGCDDHDLLGRQPEDLGQSGPEGMGGLGCGPDPEPTMVDDGGDGPGLDGGRELARVPLGQRDPHRIAVRVRRGRRRAVGPEAAGLQDRGRAGQRLIEIEHRIGRLDEYVDRLGRIGGQGRGLGHHRGQHLAGEADTIDRQQGLGQLVTERGAERGQFPNRRVVE